MSFRPSELKPTTEDVQWLRAEGLESLRSGGPWLLVTVAVAGFAAIAATAIAFIGIIRSGGGGAMAGLALLTIPAAAAAIALRPFERRRGALPAGATSVRGRGWFYGALFGSLYVFAPWFVVDHWRALPAATPAQLIVGAGVLNGIAFSVASWLQEREIIVTRTTVYFVVGRHVMWRSPVEDIVGVVDYTAGAGKSSDHGLRIDSAACEPLRISSSDMGDHALDGAKAMLHERAPLLAERSARGAAVRSPTTR